MPYLSGNRRVLFCWLVCCVAIAAQPPPPPRAVPQETEAQRIKDLQNGKTGDTLTPPVLPSAGHAVAVQWWSVLPGPLPYEKMIGGAHDNDQNLDEYLCVASLVVPSGAGRATVPGKLEGNHCDIAYENHYLQATDFSVAERTPADHVGYWGYPNEHPQTDWATGGVDENGKPFYPCVVHYQTDKSTVDALWANITGGDPYNEHGDEFGHIEGKTCVFEWGKSEVNLDDSGDHKFRVYFLNPPPPPPKANKGAPTPPAKAGGDTVDTFKNLTDGQVYIFTAVFTTSQGAPDCDKFTYVGSIAPDASWAAPVPAGKFVWVRIMLSAESACGESDNKFETSIQGGHPETNETWPIGP